MTFEQALLALLAAIAVGSVVIAVAAVRVGSLSERRPDPEVRRRTNNLAAGEASKRRAS